MEDIKEIKADVKVLLQQGAVHNQILLEHKAYSVALQGEQKVINERIRPIEQHVIVMSTLLKILGGLMTGGLIQYLVTHFLMK